MATTSVRLVAKYRFFADMYKPFTPPKKQRLLRASSGDARLMAVIVVNCTAVEALAACNWQSVSAINGCAMARAVLVAVVIVTFGKICGFVTRVTASFRSATLGLAVPEATSGKTLSNRGRKLVTTYSVLSMVRLSTNCPSMRKVVVLLKGWPTLALTILTTVWICTTAGNGRLVAMVDDTLDDELDAAGLIGGIAYFTFCPIKAS